MSEPGGLEAEVRLRRGDLDLDVGVAVAPGEVVAVVGPNAAGKSTFLAAVAGLVPVAAGRVRLGDRLLDDPAAGTFVPPERRSVGLVFQDLLLFPHLSVLDNVTLAPMLTKGIKRPVAEKRAMELLDMVGLADKAKSVPAQLSGGQKQRVAIARALALSPKIMLFDEVTSALDPELVEEVLNVMRRLASETDMTMLLVTHEMGFAHDFADRVLFFDRGKIVEEGKPSDIFRNPTQERTQTFLRKIIAAGHRV